MQRLWVYSKGCERGASVTLGALLNRIVKTSVSPNTDVRGKHPSIVSCVSMICWGGAMIRDTDDIMPVH